MKQLMAGSGKITDGGVNGSIPSRNRLGSGQGTRLADADIKIEFGFRWVIAHATARKRSRGIFTIFWLLVDGAYLTIGSGVSQAQLRAHQMWLQTCLSESAKPNARPCVPTRGLTHYRDMTVAVGGWPWS